MLNLPDDTGAANYYLGDGANCYGWIKEGANCWFYLGDGTNVCLGDGYCYTDGASIDAKGSWSSEYFAES